MDQQLELLTVSTVSCSLALGETSTSMCRQTSLFQLNQQTLCGLTSKSLHMPRVELMFHSQSMLTLMFVQMQSCLSRLLATNWTYPEQFFLTKNGVMPWSSTPSCSLMTLTAQLQNIKSVLNRSTLMSSTMNITDYQKMNLRTSSSTQLILTSSQESEESSTGILLPKLTATHTATTETVIKWLSFQSTWTQLVCLLPKTSLSMLIQLNSSFSHMRRTNTGLQWSQNNLWKTCTN